MDETRQRLLDAAGRAFAKSGFDSATVREICQQADANVAAVNYYFGDKKRLYIEAVREAYCARSDSTPTPSFDPALPPADRLRDFIKIFLTRLLDGGHADWHLGLVLRELAQPTEACTEIVRDYIRPMAEVLGEIVAEILPPGSKDKNSNLICFSIVGQCLFHYVHRPIIRELIGADDHQRHSIDLLADHIANFSLSALGHPPIDKTPWKQLHPFHREPTA